MKQIRQIIDAIKNFQGEITESKNTFNEIQTRELETQWKHKVSVVPEDEGITVRWWDYSDSVVRDGPEAKLANDQDFIRTKQSGEYIVGDPALGGMALRMEGTASSSSDDFWGGYTNRLNNPVGEQDGAGIGHSYFNKGDGDEGGALEDGEQEYVWFRSAIDGVSNKRIPRDQWNGDNIDDVAPAKGEMLKKGGFNRIKFTFYNQGSVDINYGFKLEDGTVDIRTIHSINIEGSPMWQQSDLHMEAQKLGANLTGYCNAAHFKSGRRDLTIRENGETRAPPVTGSSVSVTQGDPIPLVSIQLRDGWENVNIQPVGLSVEMDDSFIVFIAVGGELTGANFSAPNSDITGITPTGSEYAALSDNDASDFSNIGELEFVQYVQGSRTGASSSQISQTIPDFSLANGEIATVGIVPVSATNFEGASLRWGGNF